MLSDKEIRRVCGGATFERGRRYFDQGHVLELSTHKSKEATLLRASVAGTRSRPYEVSASVSAVTADLRGSCSCPMEEDCKHVVAVLLKYRSDVEDLAKPAGDKKERSSSSAQVDRREWQAWLDLVEADESRESESASKDAAHRQRGLAQAIHYVLSPHVDPFDRREDARWKGGEGLRAELRRSKLKMTGGWKKGYPVRPESLVSYYWTPDYAEQSDRHIASLLCAGLSRLQGSVVALSSESSLSSTVLLMMLETGRVWWEQVGGLRLSLKEPQAAHLAWLMDGAGTQTLRAFVDEDRPVAVLDLGAYWGLDLENGTFSQLRFDVPENKVRKALMSPSLPPTLSRDKLLRKRLLGLPFAPPRAIETKKVESPAFTAELRLAGVDAYRDPNFDFLRARPVAILSCSYGEHRIQLAQLEELVAKKLPQVCAFVGDKLLSFDRDQRKERALARALQQMGLQDIAAGALSNSGSANSGSANSASANSGAGLMLELPPLPRMIVPSEARRAWMQGWLALARHPALSSCSFIDVTVDASFPLQVVDPDTEALNLRFDSDGDEAGSSDWFEIGVGIDVDGQHVDLVPILLTYMRSVRGQHSPEPLSEAQELLLPLQDGRLLRVDAARFGKIFRYLLSLFEQREAVAGPQKPARLGTSAVELLPLLEAAEADGSIEFEGGNLPQVAARLRDFVRASLRASTQKVAPPSTLKAELRGYQRDGLRWLQNLHRHELSGLLADDMGLGKTVQAIAHLLSLRRRRRLAKPALIVCPTSVLPNWKSEMERFSPSLRVVVHHGSERHGTQDGLLLDKPHVVLTTYPILVRDQELLVPLEYSVAILDESQTIKNSKAKVSSVCYALRAEQRIAMSGTPIENHLGELWSIFRFLMPALFGSETSFRQNFRTPIEKHGDRVAQEVLQARIRPFVLRRRKEEVAKELPPKVEQTRFIKLGRKERDLYETIRASMAKKVRQQIAKQGLGRSHILFLDALLKLRQVCCDPRLSKKVPQKHVGSKLTELFSFLPDLVEQGRRVLLFSQFTSMLALIEEELRAHNIAYAKLTGTTRNREQAIDAFRNGDARVFLVSLKAGGTGLNLVEADTVIHYDPWWNPAVEAQATDRAHRIGQTQSVTVYRMVAQGTVEERILALQERKRALATIAEDGAATSSQFTEADVEALLRPL